MALLLFSNLKQVYLFNNYNRYWLRIYVCIKEKNIRAIDAPRYVRY